MSAKWCSSADVFDQVPEFLNDSIAGVLEAERVNRTVVRATQMVREKVSGRYDLDVLEAGLTAKTLGRLVHITAMQAGEIIVSRYNLGTSKKTRKAEITDSLQDAWLAIANGSLYYDDGTKVATLNDPSSYLPESQSTTESLLEEIYADGDRYGQPTT